MSNSIRKDKKDWELSKLAFGTTTKDDCSIIKRLRKNGTFEMIDDCDDWCIAVEKNKDDCGWLLPLCCLTGFESARIPDRTTQCYKDAIERWCKVPIALA